MIVLPPLSHGVAESWNALLELAPAFGDNWMLVGRQMVFLHELERQAADVIPTDDIILVVDLGAEPDGLARIQSALVAGGFKQNAPGLGYLQHLEGSARRYCRSAAVLDVLAADLSDNATQLTLAPGRTAHASTMSDSFRRREVVTVHGASGTAQIRRPDLVGTVLLEAASVRRFASSPATGRGKILYDLDAVVRMLGPSDRQGLELTDLDRRACVGLAHGPKLSEVAVGALMLLARRTSVVNTGSVLSDGFPKELEPVVARVGSLIGEPYLAPLPGDEVALGDKLITIPSRLYTAPPLPGVLKSFNRRELTIARCLLSRHHNGFVRQRQIVHLVASPEPWAASYVLALLGEYVIDIHSAIATDLLPELESDDSKRKTYSELLANDPMWWLLIQNRIISYWQEYYRRKYPIDRSGSKRRLPENYPAAQVVRSLTAVEGVPQTLRPFR